MSREAHSPVSVATLNSLGRKRRKMEEDSSLHTHAADMRRMKSVSAEGESKAQDRVRKIFRDRQLGQLRGLHGPLDKPGRFDILTNIYCAVNRIHFLNLRN